MAEAGGHITGLSDPSGRAEAYGYDGSGDLVSFRDGAGGTWTYGYDGSGNLASVADPDGRLSTLAYDSGHRHRHHLRGHQPGGGVSASARAPAAELAPR